MPFITHRHGTSRHRLVRWLFIVVAAAIVQVSMLGASHPSANASGRPSVFPVQYAGVNYYDPSDYFTHCPDFTWLEPSCYDNPNNPDPPRAQLISDLKFSDESNLGAVQRVWISLDELMQWNSKSGFVRFTPGVLHNVDDMLSIYHSYGMRVILVLYAYDGSNWKKQFHPEALDGDHTAMRANYLRAERIFIQHLAANPIDVSTTRILELATEPYYQLEVYFNDTNRLGSFTRCASTNQSNWGCVDRQIIHPWLESLYRTARSASHSFLYTFSDTGRMLHSYRYWNSMYPEDVIDEHLYDSTPWNHSRLYKRALRFTKPWFASEVGCSTGDVSCTYGAEASTPVDDWWLSNLRSDGARAVLIECHVTVWLYPDGPASQTPTATGNAIAQANRFPGIHLGVH